MTVLLSYIFLQDLVMALPDVHMTALQWHAEPENDCATESVHSMQGPDDFAFLANFLNGEPCQMARLLKLQCKEPCQMSMYLKFQFKAPCHLAL